MLRSFRDLGGFPEDADIDQIAEELNLDELMTQNPNDVSAEDMALQMRELMNRLVAHGAKLPKELFLYMKGMVYLNGAITKLAADVDMFTEIAHIYELFTTTHLEHLEALDVDLTQLPGADGLTERMKEQMGIDADTMTFREMQLVQQERAEEFRAARKNIS